MVGRALALLAAAINAPAQTVGLSADSLLALGRLASAESAFYAGVRAQPRDPAARASLGRFLAARGATRVGTVLLEEARFFGGDSAELARLLIPLYARLGDYKAILGIAPTVVPPNQLERAAWLMAHPGRAVLSDSSARLSYRATRGTAGFGTVLLRLGTSELPATIDPSVSGLVVPVTLRGLLRVFGDSSSDVALATLRIGTQPFDNIPTSIAPAGTAVRIGFDVLAPFSPSFDPGRGRITLRRPDRLSKAPAGVRVPALFDGDGLRLLMGGRWVASPVSPASILLASRAWTWDARRGDVILLNP